MCCELDVADDAEVCRALSGTWDGEALPLPDKPSIAVLAFTNMSGDPEQEYFSDGIADDIITELSRSRSLFVIARNSSFTYKERAVDIKQMARELGVRYVLEGSVRRSGGRVRVTAQLIDAETGNHIWAERYDRRLERSIRRAGRDHRGGREGNLARGRGRERQRALRKPPENLERLGGVSAWPMAHGQDNRLPTTNKRRSFFRRAITMDSNFVPRRHLAIDIHREGAYLQRDPVGQKSVELAASGAQGHCHRSR